MDTTLQTNYIDTARTRSIDNLQRLYTVVVSLAITESLRRLFLTTQTLTLSDIAAVLSLIATIIPFYHGANRYLDATYVTGERSEPKSGALMADFIAIFIEGIAFFILAVLISNTKVFFSILAGLFMFDALWVSFTKLTENIEEKKVGPSYRKWAVINIIFGIFILISIWSNLLKWQFWETETVKLIALACAAILRTVLDYIQVWRFYYPLQKGAPDVLPAPLPAPVPVVLRMMIKNKEKKSND
jgi:hypothetical protein